MNRIILTAFVFCQLIGELAVWLSSGQSPRGGPWAWVIGVVFLLPGDIAASWLIEKFLWGSSLTLHQLQWFKVPCEIVINGAVWLIFAACVSRGIGMIRRPGRKAARS
jgi:hypothetical protein